MPSRARQVAEFFATAQSSPALVIQDSDLLPLPKPMQRYLRYARVIGKPPIRSVRLKQHGFFRTSPQQKWMPLSAEEYHTTSPPGFLWFGTIRPFRFLPITGRDLFSGGHGRMTIRVASLITIGDSQGPENDQGELLRFLSEIIWFPTAWLLPAIEWRLVSRNCVCATLQHEGVTVSADLTINDKDQLTRIEGQRYRTVGKKYSLDPWVVSAGEYHDVHGFRIPTKGVAVWKLPDGAFNYFRGTITQIEYDKPQPY